MNMIINGNRTELEKRAATIFADHVSDLLKTQGHVVAGLVGGTSVAGVYKGIKKQPLPWDRIHFFMADERVVDINHPDSNFTLVDNIFRKVASVHLHPCFSDKKKDDFGASDYTSLLKKYGGVLDLLILSCGEDGHVASLFPAHSSVLSGEKGFVAVMDSPKPPAERISASKNLLLQAKVALLLVMGTGKHHIIDRCFDEKISIEKCPAKLIRKIPDHYIFTDRGMG